MCSQIRFETPNSPAIYHVIKIVNSENGKGQDVGEGVETCGVEIVMWNGTAGDGERIREAQSLSELSACVLSYYIHTRYIQFTPETITCLWHVVLRLSCIYNLWYM